MSKINLDKFEEKKPHKLISMFLRWKITYRSFTYSIALFTSNLKQRGKKGVTGVHKQITILQIQAHADI